jgi:hypothetical protein
MSAEEELRVELKELRVELDHIKWLNGRLRWELDAQRARRSEPPDPPVNPDPAAVYDHLGRKQPARLNAVHFARVIPGYAALFSGHAPDNFVAQVDEDVVEVACVCKPDELPRCKRLVPTPCRCGRWFVYDGSSVRVAKLSSDPDAD